jgi:hypothetical protein
MKRFLAVISLFFLATIGQGQVGPSLYQGVLAVPGAAVGDTYYTSTTGGRITRLPIGTVRQCSLVVSGIPAWSSGCFDLTVANMLTNVAAPSTPASGTTAIWTDLTDKNLKAKDDAGVVTVTVKPDAGATSNFLTAISSAGLVSKAHPAASDLSNGVTGSGAVVLASGPTLGAATASSINGVSMSAGTSPITLGNTSSLAQMTFPAASSDIAPLASPAFTGTPAAPTATVGTNTTQLATTAFVLANTSPPGAGSGSVTSVGLALPSFITVSGSPVTGAGTLTGTLATQVTKTFLAGPTSGADAAPTFRTIAAADVPTLNQNTSGSAATLTTPRAINGVNFDGSAPITVTADANTLSGTTLKSTVVNSSLTSVGTLGSLTVTNPITGSVTGSSGSTAGNAATVTTNANLTGPVTSSGNATTVAAAQPSITSVGTLSGLTVTAAPTFSALMSGYVPVASTAGLMTNSHITTDGTNIDISPSAATPYANASLTVSDGVAARFQGGAVTLPYGVSLKSGYSVGFLIFSNASGTPIPAYFNASEYHLDGGNVGIGTAAFGTSAGTVLGIGNGTAPTSSPASMVQLWSEVVTATQELRVRDGAGNVTTLSPHNFSMFTPAATQAFPWSYYSKNAHIGKEINVDMYGAIAALEKLSGQKFIYVNDLLADQLEDWTTQEAANKIAVEKQRLDKELAKEVEVAATDALEVVAITKQGPSATLTQTVTRYVLDAASGTVKPVTETTPQMETVNTGKTETRLKAGIRLDEKTGKFWRHVTASEAVVEPYVPKEPPAWMKDRMARKAAVN